MTRTSIEWADRVWNPTTGCTAVSEGCRNCYAKRFFARFNSTPFEKIVEHKDRLDWPLSWRPSVVFVNSMSDLFHPDVSDWLINRVVETIANTPKHVYLILTKRPHRAAVFFQSLIACCGKSYQLRTGCLTPLPLRNLWIGTSIEDHETARERTAELAGCPAAGSFLSYEPALGPVQWNTLPIPDWIIAGGESGPKNLARPASAEWFLAARDFCRKATIPFFFKQGGTHWPKDEQPDLLEGKTCHEVPAAVAAVSSKLKGATVYV